MQNYPQEVEPKQPTTLALMLKTSRLKDIVELFNEQLVREVALILSTEVVTNNLKTINEKTTEQDDHLMKLTLQHEDGEVIFTDSIYMSDSNMPLEYYFKELENSFLVEMLIKFAKRKEKKECKKEDDYDHTSDNMERLRKALEKYQPKTTNPTPPFYPHIEPYYFKNPYIINPYTITCNGEDVTTITYGK